MSWTWDPDKSNANLRKHRLSFAAAVLVFNDPVANTVPDPHPFEQRWRTTGWIGNRIVTVIHTTSVDAAGEGDRSGRIISARKATPAERRAHEEGIR